jgi:hypothetical protein
MSVYPYDIDDDTTILRVDDNVTEISGQNFNQVRDAVFKIEIELGLTPSGTQSSVRDFLLVSHNADGSIKDSALTSVGLVTLPIDNADVGVNAGIVESKLTLDYSTSTLRVLIQANASQIQSISDATNNVITNLSRHIGGGPAADLRHVLSHIDVNAIPSDNRDVNFTWDGLKNTAGGLRPATHLGQALEQINDELVDHQLTANPTFGHNAVGIRVDPSNFSEIPSSVDDVQGAIDALDSLEETRIGVHRATMHSQGVPPDSRSSAIVKPDAGLGVSDSNAGTLDGYGTTVVPARRAVAYVASTGGVVPVDSTLNGDNVIQFAVPDADDTKRQLDSEFVLVTPGDIARINYGTGVEAMFIVESTRFIPGSQWAFRVDGNNLIDTDGYSDAYVRIDKPLFDKEIWGVAAAAASNAYPTASFSGFLSSVIVSDPRSAVALGINFDPNQLDGNHYNLYLQVYPTGNPSDKVITLPGIDVTGNSGATPGDYTLEKVVQATNNSLRAAGVNARFVAFGYNGSFGITMADAIGGASFSIVTGERSGSGVIEGSYTNNVLNPTEVAVLDPLGLGPGGSDYASPAYSSDPFVDSVISLKPTKIIMPRKRRYYIADGSRRDFLRSTPLTENSEIIDGYWQGTITDRISVPGVTAKTEYTILKDLKTAGLFSGKTITVQPLVSYSDSLYNNADYGRFIIESVQYIPQCPGDTAKTILTVINGVHADPAANPEGTSTGASANLSVAIHFDHTSVGFNQNNMIDQSPGGQYHRLHEIYATSDSKTLSHERLRIPVQSGAGSALGTQDWRVRGASPKLRGFTDSTTSLDKYVRFYILSYDATSGEYDGYIGRRNISNDNISETGPITTGRKEVPVRFYDNTGNDYIELEFLETSVVPAAPTTILAPAYVDIGVFPSLELDDELTLLATCEVNWQSPTTQIVERIIDRRQVGSVSEKELTQSAKEFLSAADRYLHANSVIKGFQNFGEDPVDSTSILIGGGVGIVNGTIITANNSKVRIPELVPDGGGSGSTVTWVICIDENGKFIPLPLTATKEHFFAEAGTGGGTPYFIPSVTFTELIDERKDLLPLYVVTATINSVSLGTLTDIRKYPGDINSLKVLASGSYESNNASFRSFESLEYWENNYGISEVKVISVNVSTPASLSFNSKVRMYGGTYSLSSTLGISNCNIDGATISITELQGLSLSDSTLRDSSITYTPATTPAYTANDMINITHGYAINLGDDVIIEGCSFYSSLSQRPPFIATQVTQGSVRENILINMNVFDGPANNDNCAVCFSQTTVSTSSSSYLRNVHVTNNQCKDEQCIVIGSTGTSFQGWRCSASSISGNRCGIIGYLVSSQSDADLNSGLVISDNTCQAISTARTTYSSGHVVAPLNTLGSGNVSIKNNVVSGTIYGYVGGDSADPYRGSLIIDGNIVYAEAKTTTNKWFNSPTTWNGILVLSSSTGSGLGSVISSTVNNNKVYLTDTGAGVVTTINGIRVLGSSNITNNRVDVVTSISNISCIIAERPSTGFSSYTVISGNQLFRFTSSITNYIQCGTSVNGLVVDNFIDNWDVGTGVMTSAISTVGDVTVERNKGHRVAAYISKLGTGGIYSISGVPIGTPSFISTTSTISNVVSMAFTNPANTSSYDYRVVISTGIINFKWITNLESLIPNGVTIIGLDMQYAIGSPNTDYASNSDIILNLFKGLDSSYVTATAEVDARVGPLTGTLSISGISVKTSERPIIELYFSNMNNGSGQKDLDTYPILVTYEW